MGPQAARYFEQLLAAHGAEDAFVVEDEDDESTDVRAGRRVGPF